MIAHISRCKRNDKSGIHLGGVEKFAMYLRMAIPELQLFSWEDFPGWIRLPDEKDYDKASMLNQHLLEKGIVDKDSTVIVDGYWGLGLEGKVKRLISVVHGSYFGRFIQSQLYPWGETVFMDQSEAQIELWDHEQTEVVAVSNESAKEIRNCTNKSVFPMIPHGIDLDIFKPLQEKDRFLFLHAATSARKGIDIIGVLGQQGYFPVPMAEGSGRLDREAKKISQFRWLVSPTRHEGNSYLLIEALACGTVPITYATGIAPELPGALSEFVTDDLTWTSFLRLLKRADAISEDEWDTKYSQAARAWAVEHCSFGRFAKEWREFIG